MALAEDLDKLDVTIRQLQVKWDLFFNGQEKKPPSDLQTHVETLIKRYANSEIRNNGERFRYQSLSARYTTFNELWQKRLRAREEGKAFGMHGIRAEQLPPPKAAAPPPAEVTCAVAGAGRPLVKVVNAPASAAGNGPKSSTSTMLLALCGRSTACASSLPTSTGARSPPA